MKIIEKYKRKTEGLSNTEIAKEAALLIKSRLIHRYRLAKALFTSDARASATASRASGVSSTGSALIATVTTWPPAVVPTV